jgi:putative membrane protein
MGWSWGFGLLALVGVAVLVYLVIRLSTKNGQSGPSSPTGPASPAGPASPDLTSARKILDERFARGELTPEQYREHIRVLAEDR